MFLVKSCFKKDNIKKRKTIRIGSLIEYRQTEYEQIVDKSEGTIRLSYDLHNAHIDRNLFNFLNYNHHSNNNVHIGLMEIGGASSIFPASIFLVKFVSSYELENFNRFTFCISLLDNPEESNGIFPDYDDYWSIDYKSRHIFAEAVSKKLLKEVIGKISGGVKLFAETPNVDKLDVRVSISEINYVNREIKIDNRLLYTNIQSVIDSIQKPYIIKPTSFSHEKEVRFVFDIYEGNKLLHPLEKSIIIDVSDLIALVN